MCFSSPHADLPEPRVRGQPGSHLRGPGPDGRLGLLHRRRLPEEPQALPHLQRQGLPARQPPAQITPRRVGQDSTGRSSCSYTH